MTLALPSRKHPPIVEVVCAFFFDAMPGIDPMLVGEFGVGKKSIYTTHALKPPVADVAGFTVSEGIGPLRCWLVSARGEFAICSPTPPSPAFEEMHHERSRDRVGRAVARSSSEASGARVRGNHPSGG